MKYLTESQAWRKIAKRIKDGKWSKLGLCREIVALVFEGLVTQSVCSWMLARIQHMQNRIGHPLFLFNPGDAEPRIKLARKFAVQSKPKTKRKKQSQ